MKYEIHVTGSKDGLQVTVHGMRPISVITKGLGAPDHGQDDVSYYVARAFYAFRESAHQLGEADALTVTALGFVWAALQRMRESRCWGGKMGDPPNLFQLFSNAVAESPTLSGETRQLLQEQCWESLACNTVVDDWVVEKIRAEMMRLDRAKIIKLR